MTLLCQIFYQLWMPFCDPSENKKCGLGRIFQQHIGNFPGIGLDSARELVPLSSSRHRPERRYLEMFFYVEGDSVPTIGL
jgi:hypothetical protein